MTAFMQPRQGDQGGGVMNRYEEFLVRLGRVGIGIELKPSYYQQALRNLAAVDDDDAEPDALFDMSGAVVSA